MCRVKLVTRAIVHLYHAIHEDVKFLGQIVMKQLKFLNPGTDIASDV